MVGWDIVRIVLVSWVDFFALIFLSFAIFRINITKNLNVTIIFSIFLSVISNVMIFYKIPLFIMIPVQLLIIFLYTFYYLGEKFRFSFWSIIVGYMLYNLIQVIIITLFIQSGYITTENLSQSYTVEGSYVTLVYACVSIIVSSYVKVFNGGFAFFFRRKNNESLKIYTLLIVLTMLLILVFTTLLHFFKNATNNIFIVYMITIVIISITLYIFSKKRDDDEYKRY